MNWIQENMNWINVKDQHPPAYERFIGVWERADDQGAFWQLVTIGQGSTNKDGVFISHVAGELKHWMPIPVPPQE